MITTPEVEQLLALMVEAMSGPGPDDAFTTTELVGFLSERTGRSLTGRLREEVKALITQLQREGKLQRLKVQRVSEVDGRRARVTGYRMVRAT